MIAKAREESQETSSEADGDAYLFQYKFTKVEQALQLNTLHWLTKTVDIIKIEEANFFIAIS